jgi:hypothetical protein
MDGSFLRPNRTVNKRSEHRGRCARNHGEARGTRCTASPFHNHGDPRLTRPAAIPPCAIASDVGLVGLDIAFQKRSWDIRKTRSKLGGCPRGC